MGGLPQRWSAGASLRSSALSSRKQRQVEITYFAHSNSTCCRCSSSLWLGLSSFSALHGEAFWTERLHVMGSLPARLNFIDVGACQCSSAFKPFSARLHVP